MAALLDAKQQTQQAQAQLAQVTRERDEARAELAKVKAVPKKP
jgi:F0F1-type ATP synthase membrane subunit b/b'